MVSSDIKIVQMILPVMILNDINYLILYGMKLYDITWSYTRIYCILCMCL